MIPAAEPIKKRYWETSDFWKDAGERIVTSFLIVTVTSLTITDGEYSWKVALASGVGAAISTVKAIVGAQRKDATTPVSIF